MTGTRRAMAIGNVFVATSLLGACGGPVVPSGTDVKGATTMSSSRAALAPASLCVATINQYRATLGLAAYAQWTDAETCADGQAERDAASGTAHSAFGQCAETAQNECPAWPGPPASMVGDCFGLMWSEGPGADFSLHGHYINMSSTSYTKVACGFFTTAGGLVWATQDFK